MSFDPFRSTGRTTRMIEKANKYREENPEAVIYIVGHTYRYASELARQVPGSVPIGSGESERLRGVVGKAFVDRAFWERHLVSVRDRENMYYALNMLAARTSGRLVHDKGVNQDEI